MKQTLLFTALGLAAFGAAAQEVGQVISSTPVIQQVAVPRTYCNQGVPIAQPQTSGGGGLLGAIAGAALGSTIGHGSGTAAAVLLGTVGGAIVGNNIEANNNARYAYAQPACATETSYENRAVGYDVTYEYAGREYTVRMPHDPGPTIQLQVSPVGSSLPPPQAGGPVVAPPVVVAQAPAPVIVQSYAQYPAYPAYPVYGYPAYRPVFPVAISLGFGFHHHGHRHGHRHRR